MNTTTGNLSKALDLTENEIKVYKGFVSNPGVSAAEISRILHMDKSSAYRSVSNLVDYGLLIASPKNEVMTYITSDVGLIKERYEDRLNELISQKSNIEQLISTLVSTSKRKTNIRVEEGIQAVQKAMAESLNCEEKLIREKYMYHKYFNLESHVSFVLDFAKTRIKNGVWIYQLEHDLLPKIKDFRKIMISGKKFMKEIRKLPDELNDMNSLRIWDNTTNIFSEDERGETIVITINDKYVAQFMKGMYDFIWGRCEKLSS